jgi:hypothetical protein
MSDKNQDQEPIPLRGRVLLRLTLIAALATLSNQTLSSASAAPLETDAAVVDGAPHLPNAVPRVGPIHRRPDGQIELIDPTKETGKDSRLCANGTICVGHGQAYPNLTAAIAVARQGDVIEIVAGTYRETAKIAVSNLIIRGINGQAHVDCTGIALTEEKSCLLLAADGVTLDNLEISGAEVADGAGSNGACVRNDPNISFTLRRISCHDSQAGILSDGGTILIENSEFYDNGWGERTHNVFFNGRCSVTVRGSTFRDSRVGHEFKSRCDKTMISDSTFRSTTGSRNLDIAGGGETLLYRSTLVKMPGTENHGIIAFASESCAHPGDMVVKDTRIVNSEPQAELRNFDKCAGHPIVLDGVTFEGIPPQQYGYIKSPAAGTALTELVPEAPIGTARP